MGHGLEAHATAVRELFEKFVVPSYARFELVLDRGEGSYVWDVNGRRYLDLGGGIAVSSLGHGHPEITKALTEQSRKLVHISNLYYNELQGRLAKRIVDSIAPGRVFFCNSGAEANEGLFKLARKFGHDEGRYEIITTFDSFHGRTLAGIAATGQEKVKKGFEPAVSGFKHVPFNDLEAMSAAITKSTIAVLVEPIQGESGITIATPEYLTGLRKLCDTHNLLLLFDEVQAGHFRTGEFQSWQRILNVASASGRCLDRDHRQDADATVADATGRESGIDFQPMNPFAEVSIRRGANLPHWTQANATYAVTFRLVDALPKRVLADWQLERRNIMRTARQQKRELSAREQVQLNKLHSDRIECCLDAGHGRCWLRDKRIAAVVRDAILRFEGERYTLVAWCIMPNHVHVIVRPFPKYPLSEILHAWKSFTAKETNRLLKRRGGFWQLESYDHLIRNEQDLRNQVCYVMENPSKAGLAPWPWVGPSEGNAGMRFQPVAHRQDADATMFLPDGVSMAKALGGGFPIGAFWVRDKFANVLSAGTHASTFGGTPLASAVALRIFDVIERDNLANNARKVGDFLISQLRTLSKKHATVLRDVRGFGLIIGLEFDPDLPAFQHDQESPAVQVVNRLHEKGVLTVPAAKSVIRLLPALNLLRSEAEEGLRAIRSVVADLASS
jgi:acetylornithine/succinyldiaminopimelate/putrescine aminotransferase/REP element-mobilizing transposase RayT